MKNLRVLKQYDIYDDIDIEVDVCDCDDCGFTRYEQEQLYDVLNKK